MVKLFQIIFAMLVMSVVADEGAGTPPTDTPMPEPTPQEPSAPDYPSEYDTSGVDMDVWGEPVNAVLEQTKKFHPSHADMHGALGKHADMQNQSNADMVGEVLYNKYGQQFLDFDKKMKADDGLHTKFMAKADELHKESPVAVLSRTYEYFINGGDESDAIEGDEQGMATQDELGGDTIDDQLEDAKEKISNKWGAK